MRTPFTLALIAATLFTWGCYAANHSAYDETTDMHLGTIGAHHAMCMSGLKAKREGRMLNGWKVDALGAFRHHGL